MNSIFADCESLISLPDISKWNNSNNFDEESILSEKEILNFSNAELLYKRKFTDLSTICYMFSNCKSLVSLPDISGWNTSHVTSMSHLFSNCEALLSLPDISKWKLNDTINISYMFNNCKSLLSIPDISKWNTENINNMEFLFNNCESLTLLPDISKWKFMDSNSIINIFSNCKSLISLPDISKWNVDNKPFMNYLFFNCISLISLPQLKKWNIKDKDDILNSFDNCISFLAMPDFTPDNNDESESEIINKSDTIKNDNLKSLKIIDNKKYASNKKNKIEGILEIDLDGMQKFINKNKNLIICLNNKKINNNNICDFFHKKKAEKYLFKLVFYKANNKLNFYFEHSKIISIDLSEVDTSDITSMKAMFCGCHNLKELKGLNNFNTSKVKNMSFMFKSCSELEYLDYLILIIQMLEI